MKKDKAKSESICFGINKNGKKKKSSKQTYGLIILCQLKARPRHFGAPGL